MNKKKKRLLWADAIRVVAIYFVILAHATAVPRNPTFLDASVIIVCIIARTCIPLFVMLSGALLLSKKESYRAFFSKRMMRIMFPWIGWTIFFILFQQEYVKIDGVGSFIKIIIGTMESFWFLPMIFCLYLITPALRIFAQSAKTFDILLVIIFWIFVISIMPFHHDSYTFPRSVDNGLLRQVVNFIGYYILGFVIVHRVKNDARLLKIGIASFGIGLFWYITNTIPIFLRGEDFNPSVEYISPGNIFLSIGIFIFLYIFSQKATKKISSNLRNSVMVISSAALGIYFIHGVVGGYINNFYLVSSLFALNNIVNATLLFAVSLLIVLLLLKVPFLNKFVS